MCFPTFLLIITVAAVLPPNIFNIMVIIGIFGWPGMTRLIRGQFLSLRGQDFVIAAVAVGVPTRRIIFRHILPNVVGPVVVAATLGLAGAILTESSLSFLGLGVQQPTPSWGQTLTTALQLPISGEHALALAAFGDCDCLYGIVDELFRRCLARRIRPAPASGLTSQRTWSAHSMDSPIRPFLTLGKRLNLAWN